MCDKKMRNIYSTRTSSHLFTAVESVLEHADDKLVKEQATTAGRRTRHVMNLKRLASKMLPGVCF